MALRRLPWRRPRRPDSKKPRVRTAAPRPDCTPSPAERGQREAQSNWAHPPETQPNNQHALQAAARPAIRAGRGPALGKRAWRRARLGACPFDLCCSSWRGRDRGARWTSHPWRCGESKTQGDSPSAHSAKGWRATGGRWQDQKWCRETYGKTAGSTRLRRVRILSSRIRHMAPGAWRKGRRVKLGSKCAARGA